MNKRWLLNAGLACLLAALALLAWFQPGAKTQKKASVTITDLRAQDVETLKIAQPHRDTAVFKREHGHWHMLKPVHARADEALITSLLDEIREKSSRQYPVQGLDLKQFGLQTPKLSLTLNDETLEFGATSPIGHKRYIRRGNSVYLVNDILLYRLQGDPLSFVSKRLLPKDAKITALALPDVKLTRSTDGRWQLTPAKPKITSDQIQELIDHWNGAQAFNVKAADDMPVAGRVEVSLAGRAQPIQFEVLKNASLLMLVRPDLGVEYQLPATHRDTLLNLTPEKKTDQQNAQADTQE